MLTACSVTLKGLGDKIENLVVFLSARYTEGDDMGIENGDPLISFRPVTSNPSERPLESN